MAAGKFRRISAIILGLAVLIGASPLAAQEEEDWADRPHYSSFAITMGYNTFSPAGDTRFVQYASYFTGNSGFVVGVRALWSPNFLGHFLSIGGEYQGLAVANSDSSIMYYKDSGKPVTDTDYADLWQFLIGAMFANSENLLVQAQFGYGSWKAGADFSEAVASARLIVAFPIIYPFFTVDPEIAYYKGLGRYKNSAFSIQIGLAFRF
jgi:hypothetical protein